jgi:hypothetical protein
MVRSDLYLALLPMIHAGQCELLDNRTLRTQLEGLDRKTARSGRDSVDDSPGGHDDVANASAGALVMCRDYQRMQPSVTHAFTGKPVTHGYSIHSERDGYWVVG